MPMGRKERLLLIEVDGVKLLLGVSAGAINVLHHFDNQATSQTNKQLPVVWGENTTATDNDLQKNTGFSEFLNSLLQGYKKDAS